MKEPRVEEEQRYAPRHGLQELPAPGRIRVLQYRVRHGMRRLVAVLQKSRDHSSASHQSGTLKQVALLLIRPNTGCVRANTEKSPRADSGPRARSEVCFSDFVTFSFSHLSLL